MFLLTASAILLSILQLLLPSDAAAATAAATAGSPVQTDHNNIVPNDHGWMSSLDGNIEFQPASDKLSPLAELHWRRLTYSTVGYSTTEFFNSNNSPYQTMYADGSETNYDEYAQAWRVLGFYIDCDDDDTLTSSTTNTGGNNKDNNQGSSSTSTCRRYLLWAAYVDEQYSGHGPGEYMYYDRHNHLWDESACIKFGNTNNNKNNHRGRCVKMDCHLPQTTHYTLLGYFKEPNYDVWIDTLTSYQGDCVWTDNEYTVMTAMSRTAWPQHCTGTIYTTKNDQVVYYDIQPLEYGGITIGLYIDDKCTQQYNTGPLTPQEVLKGMVCGGYVDGGNDHDWNCGGSSTTTTTASSSTSSSTTTTTTYYNLQNHIQSWNAAFDVFKQCQPCKAYDMTSMVAGKNYQSNTSTRHPDRQKYNSDQSYPNFMCNVNYNTNNGYYYGGGGGYGNNGNDDDNGNANNNNNHATPDYATLNQCMLFRTQTSMIPATWTDIELAGTQGTITSVQLVQQQYGNSKKKANRQSHYSYGKGLGERSRDNAHWIAAWLCLLMSMVVFCFSLYRYCAAVEDLTNVEGGRNRSRMMMNDPLMQFVPHPSAVSA